MDVVEVRAVGGVVLSKAKVVVILILAVALPSRINPGVIPPLRLTWIMAKP